MNSDIHALVGAYAVDALDDLERAAFERHLAECPACQQEVAGLQEAAGLLGALSTTAPPPSLRDRVLADITTVRPLPPAVEPPVVATGAHAPGGRSRFRPRLLVAAAAALIALGGAVTVAQPWEDETSQTQLTAAERVAAAEDAETFTKTLDNGAEATLVRSRSLNEAVLVTHDMPDAPDGSVYELWLVHDDQMVPAGLMSGGDHEIVLEGDPATANGFGITVEPDGGSDQPTSEPVTQIAFENA